MKPGQGPGLPGRAPGLVSGALEMGGGQAQTWAKRRWTDAGRAPWASSLRCRPLTSAELDACEGSGRVERWKNEHGNPSLVPGLPPASRAALTKASSPPSSICPPAKSGAFRPEVPEASGPSSGWHDTPCMSAVRETHIPHAQPVIQIRELKPSPAEGWHAGTPKETALTTAGAGDNSPRASGVPRESPYPFQGLIGGSPQEQCLQGSLGLSPLPGV